MTLKKWGGVWKDTKGRWGSWTRRVFGTQTAVCSVFGAVFSLLLSENLLFPLPPFFPFSEHMVENDCFDPQYLPSTFFMNKKGNKSTSRKLFWWMTVNEFKPHAFRNWRVKNRDFLSSWSAFQWVQGRLCSGETVQKAVGQMKAWRLQEGGFADCTTPHPSKQQMQASNPGLSD